MIEVLSAFVDEAAPEDAWNAQSIDEHAALVDVRTRAEWSFSGMPDLSEIKRNVLTVEWQSWPEMSPNLGFLSDLQEQMGLTQLSRLFFLCRTGGRSIAAA